MELLPCGHVARPGTSRLCPHLIVAADADQVRLLTGRGLAYDLCCAACDEALRAGGRVELVVACEGCVDRCTDDGEVIAWRGEPPVTDRPEPVDLTVVPVPLPVPVADIAPVSAATGSVWLLLRTDGRIGRFDADTGRGAGGDQRHRRRRHRTAPRRAGLRRGHRRRAGHLPRPGRRAVRRRGPAVRGRPARPGDLGPGDRSPHRHGPRCPPRPTTTAAPASWPRSTATCCAAGGCAARCSEVIAIRRSRRW
jgi:hypothetical protein